MHAYYLRVILLQLVNLVYQIITVIFVCCSQCGDGSGFDFSEPGFEFKGSDDEV